MDPIWAIQKTTSGHPKMVVKSKESGITQNGNIHVAQIFLANCPDPLGIFYKSWYPDPY